MSARITLLAICLISLFAALTVAVLANAVVPLDLAVNAFFGRYRIEPWLAIFVWITALGAGATLDAVVVVTTALLWVYRRTSLILPLWVTYLGTEAVTWAAKYFVDRHRPTFIAAAKASSPSFPSAHAAGSLAVYGFVAYLVAREMPPGLRRDVVALIAAALILVIGFSRIFLSVHYLTDVVGGFLISGEWLLIGCGVAEGARASRE